MVFNQIKHYLKLDKSIKISRIKKRNRVVISKIKPINNKKNLLRIKDY